MEQASIDGSTVIVGMLLLLMGFMLMLWGLLLEGKYNGPYTLISTSKGEKWKRAAIVSLLQTSIVLLFGGLFFYNNEVSSNLQKFILLLSGGWLLIIAILTLSKLWQWEMLLKNYKRMDQLIKNGHGSGT